MVEPQSGYYLKKIFRWFNEAEGSNTWRTAYDSSWSSQPEISFFEASQKRTQKKKKKHLDTCGKKKPPELAAMFALWMMAIYSPEEVDIQYNPNYH